MTKSTRINQVTYRDRRTHKLDQNIKIGSKEVSHQKTAYLYIRVSTDEQADRGFSQRDQDQRLHEYCSKNGFIVGKIIYEDYSAKTFKKRPEWSKLLAEIRSTKGRGCDMILFTKWDRFSRNAANAYNMIDTLSTYDIIPNAIDQFLDLKIPESRIMLAVYIAMAEAENLRKGLNVVVGMRRGRLEGRWMGKAPAGYINKIKPDKTKYIEINEPEASHIKWAFETIAQGIYATDVVWAMAAKNGMKARKSTFWDCVRNPIYCGKVVVPADENNELFLADGKHEALISEELFWDVQDILAGRKKTQRIKAETPINLPLRGFLYCPICNRVMTGSGSKGRKEYYYYYHCLYPCKARFKAAEINFDFERQLQKFIPDPRFFKLYKAVMNDVTSNKPDADCEMKKQLIVEISDQNNMITKLRSLFLSDHLSMDDFSIMKKKSEEKIQVLEGKLSSIKADPLHIENVDEVIEAALNRLQDLRYFYFKGTINEKRNIIGSIFPEKWTIMENKCRTTSPNLVAQLIYQINSNLEHKKTGEKTSKSNFSGLVPSAGVEPARFPTGV